MIFLKLANIPEPTYFPWLGILVLLMFSISLIYFYKIHKKSKEGKRKIYFLFILISVIILLLAIIFESLNYQEYQEELNQYELDMKYRYYESLDYRLKLNSMSEESEVVYIPISADKNLQNSIFILSGSGEIDIIETDHGEALKINFSGNIEIYGSIYEEDIGNYSLTMINNTEILDNIEIWIFYKPNNPDNYHCSFELNLFFDFSCGQDNIFSIGYLKEGWHTYLAS